MTSESRTPETTRQHRPTTEHEECEAASSSTGRVPQMNRRPTRRTTRRKRDAWLLLIALLLGIGTIMTLSYGGAQHAGHGSGTTPAAFPTAATTASATGGTPFPSARVLNRAAQAHLYPFPGSNIGLMQPAVDARGEM
jgi:hypothetical protein